MTQPGSIGEIPAAGTPSGTAGSITYALAPGAVPNWILPMPTSATNSVYNVFNFEWRDVAAAVLRAAAAPPRRSTRR